MSIIIVIIISLVDYTGQLSGEKINSIHSSDTVLTHLILHTT